MLFNSMLREEPYLGLDPGQSYRDRVEATPETGGAWLSSARVVRCSVKSDNERNPYHQLLTCKMRTLMRLPVINRRKVGMTSNHHAPYV